MQVSHPSIQLDDTDQQYGENNLEIAYNSDNNEDIEIEGQHEQQQEDSKEDRANYDNHESKALRDAHSWNFLCLVHAFCFEVLLIVQVTVWQVVITTVMLGFLPILVNVVWLFLLTPTHKQNMVSNSCLLHSFYGVQTVLFVFFVGMTTFWLASTLTTQWDEDRYLQSVVWLFTGIVLMLNSLFAALQAVSFTMLVFKFKKHSTSG